MKKTDAVEWADQPTKQTVKLGTSFLEPCDQKVHLFVAYELRKTSRFWLWNTPF